MVLHSANFSVWDLEFEFSSHGLLGLASRELDGGDVSYGL
jgi:hypothetical protein